MSVEKIKWVRKGSRHCPDCGLPTERFVVTAPGFNPVLVAFCKTCDKLAPKKETIDGTPRDPA